MLAAERRGDRDNITSFFLINAEVVGCWREGGEVAVRVFRDFSHKHGGGGCWREGGKVIGVILGPKRVKQNEPKGRHCQCTQYSSSSITSIHLPVFPGCICQHTQYTSARPPYASIYTHYTSASIYIYILSTRLPVYVYPVYVCHYTQYTFARIPSPHLPV